AAPCSARRPLPAGALQYGHRRVVPADAADASAAYRTGAAQQNVGVPRRHAPAAGRLRLRRVLVPVAEPGEGQVAVEDVAPGQAQFTLEVQRRLCLDAGPAVRVRREAVGEG